LDGQEITNLYDIVIAEVEEPLLQTVMRITGNNQSLAARLLGLSRGTLRKKLEQFGLL
jgi:Fis family transcriptional regulator